MTLADKIKTLDNKIKANQAQSSLDREAAKIFAMPSKKLDKYKYVTGEDLEYKLGVVEQAKSEYSPLGKVLNKGLKEENKKEEQLKGIKDPGKNQLDEIKKQGIKQQRVIKNQEEQLKKSQKSRKNTVESWPTVFTQPHITHFERKNSRLDISILTAYEINPTTI